MAVNEKTLTFYFAPQQAGNFDGIMSVSASDYVLTGAKEYAFDGVSYLETFDVLMQGGETWDLVSYLFFQRRTDQILKLWQDNKHLSDTDKRSFATSGDLPLFKVDLTAVELLEAEQKDNINNLPPWKQ